MVVMVGKHNKSCLLSTASPEPVLEKLTLDPALDQLEEKITNKTGSPPPPVSYCRYKGFLSNRSGRGWDGKGVAVVR